MDLESSISRVPGGGGGGGGLSCCLSLFTSPPPAAPSVSTSATVYFHLLCRPPVTVSVFLLIMIFHL